MRFAALIVASAALLFANPAAAASEAETRGRATGSFEVELTPQTQPSEVPDGRLILRKRFSGDLSGTSIGEMLTSGAAGASGAYVAIERVTGRLAGRDGTFFLAHRGLMDRGRPDLSVTVVPGSGAGGLTGLSGTMRIRIDGGRHFYMFDYRLPRPK